MKEFLRKNFAIIAAFALPVVFILVITLIAYFPFRFISTDHNFVYASCSIGRDFYDNQCIEYLRHRYSVVDNAVVVNEDDFKIDTNRDGNPDIQPTYSARLFLHDSKENESREITLEEARTLSLSGLLTSPDGITISSGYNRGADFFLFSSGGSSYGHYLTKGKSRSRLNLINEDDNYNYRDNFHFIGWVTPGRN